MFVSAIGTLIAIGIGVVIVWAWVAFVSEAIARRTGATRRVPYPDDVLWARCGGALLNLGLFGGAPVRVRVSVFGGTITGRFDEPEDTH